VDIFQQSPSVSDFRQLVFGGEPEFLVTGLKPDYRYRLSIFAVDRLSLATSKPFTLEVRTNKTNGIALL
jgi:hypothetical protein